METMLMIIKTNKLGCYRVAQSSSRNRHHTNGYWANKWLAMDGSEHDSLMPIHNPPIMNGQPCKPIGDVLKLTGWQDDQTRTRVVGTFR